MGFRLLPKSVTLNDLERCNGRVFRVISPNSVVFWGVLCFLYAYKHIHTRIWRLTPAWHAWYWYIKQSNRQLKDRFAPTFAHCRV